VLPKITSQVSENESLCLRHELNIMENLSRFFVVYAKTCNFTFAFKGLRALPHVTTKGKFGPMYSWYLVHLLIHLFVKVPIGDSKDTDTALDF